MNSKINELPKPRQRKLRLSQIRTDPFTFQPRSVDLDHGHVVTLAKVVADGRQLDRMRVRQDEDGSFTVLDGHHSYAAYRQADWKQAVPVLVYECSIAEGQLIAAKENSKARLQMTDDERRDWAWKLTCEQSDLSKKRVATTCSVGEATVGRMRKVKRQLDKAGKALPDGWKSALQAQNGSDEKEWDDDARAAWLEAAHEKLKEGIARHIVQYSVNHPELVMEVVAEVMGTDRFRLGAEHLGFLEGEVDDITGEFTPASKLFGDEIDQDHCGSIPF